MHHIIRELSDELFRELSEDILPYWEALHDSERGGFYGQVTGEDRLVPDAERSAVLNMRLLWTFSAAYRVTRDERWLRQATHIKEYIDRHFIDPTYGGVYWSVDAEGRPIDTKKQCYALGFAIYGMSEYYRATGDRSALDTACALFRTLEQHAVDPVHGGYFEAFARDWSPIADMRLSDKDTNACKSMNTHLHILEPYTNLYRVWPDAELGAIIKRMCLIFKDHILDPQTGHLRLFFNEEWQCVGSKISYGHDIESAWLLREATEVLGDKELLEEFEKVVIRIADAASEGLQPDGSLINEYDPETGHRDCDRHWWPQAENLLGWFMIYRLTGDHRALDRVSAAWEYIRTQLIDPDGGEWYWSRFSDGSANRTDDKAGFWKCPYHNGRMCMEFIEQAQALTF